MAEQFGERVRKMRLQKGLGLREAAKRLGISPTYLSRIETNEEKSPPAEKVIHDIAKLLEINFDELMTLARRIASDVEKYVTSDPGIPEFLRQAKRDNLSAADLNRLLNRKGPLKGDR